MGIQGIDDLPCGKCNYKQPMIRLIQENKHLAEYKEIGLKELYAARDERDNYLEIVIKLKEENADLKHRMSLLEKQLAHNTDGWSYYTTTAGNEIHKKVMT